MGLKVRTVYKFKVYAPFLFIIVVKKNKDFSIFELTI